MKDPNVLTPGLTIGEILAAVIIGMLLCAIGGCGEEPKTKPTPTTSAMCVARDGNYWATYVQVAGGSCPDISEHAVKISGQPQRPVSCSFGEVVYSADNCDVENVGIVCPMELPEPNAPGATYTFNGKFHWLAGGEGALGRMTAVGKNASGGVLCESTYDVVYQIVR